MNDRNISLEEQQKQFAEAIEKLPEGHRWESESRDGAPEQSESADEKPTNEA